MSVLAINGPNLNLLDTRKHAIMEPSQVSRLFSRLVPQTSQSNHEGAIIDRIHAAASLEPQVMIIITNPGALTNTYVALKDVMTGVNIGCCYCPPFWRTHQSELIVLQ
ncbi:hypothetical protein E4T44_03917 [Aureobasidium sp. EXF-8845]|nr:hypothetical protein E4T44_03917 [Aureobasidium sp. EXF-8845]